MRWFAAACTEGTCLHQAPVPQAKLTQRYLTRFLKLTAAASRTSRPSASPAATTCGQCGAQAAARERLRRCGSLFAHPRCRAAARDLRAAFLSPAARRRPATRTRLP